MEYLWLKEQKATKSLADLSVQKTAMEKVDDMVRVFSTDLEELKKSDEQKAFG